MRTLKGLLAGLLVLMLGAGCNGDDEASSASSGGPKLNELTQVEAQSLCKDITTEYSIDKAGLCRLHGAWAAATSYRQYGVSADAELQATCQSANDRCLQSIDAATSCSTEGLTIESSCTVTVDEVTTCYQDYASAYSAFFASFPACNALTTATFSPTSPLAMNITMPVSCGNAAAKCWGLFPSPEKLSSGDLGTTSGTP